MDIKKKLINTSDPLEVVETVAGFASVDVNREVTLPPFEDRNSKTLVNTSIKERLDVIYAEVFG